MPRATRAAAKAQELAEEAITAASIALPPTPLKDRVPLGDISSNANAIVKINMAEDSEAKDAQENPAAKGKKVKGGKKAKKGGKTKPQEEVPEIFEDEYQSSQSEAVEQACTDLVNENDQGKPPLHRFEDQLIT